MGKWEGGAVTAVKWEGEGVRASGREMVLGLVGGKRG